MVDRPEILIEPGKAVGVAIAVGGAVIPLDPPPPLVGVSVGMKKRGCQQNDGTLADGAGRDQL